MHLSVRLAEIIIFPVYLSPAGQHLTRLFIKIVFISFRKTIDEATKQQVFQAVSYAIKDTIIDQWIATHKEYEKKNAKTVY